MLNQIASLRCDNQPMSDERRRISSQAVGDVTVEISVVIGSTTMPIHQLLKMGRGAVIELEATVDDHAWILANNKPFARGEIVVSGETVSVQITETLLATSR